MRQYLMDAVMGVDRIKKEKNIFKIAFVLVATLVMVTFIFAGRAQAAPAQKPAGTLTWAVHFASAGDIVDPSEFEGKSTAVVYQYAIHDALFRDLPEGTRTPSLATSWSVSPDGKTYEFKIRQGVKFQNGDPLTAEDVRFTFGRYKGYGAKELKEKVKQVEVADPYTVRFILAAPWPDFMEKYTSVILTGVSWILPKNYIEKVGDAGFAKNPIGAGPYKVVNWRPGVELVAEAWEGYWRKVPNVKTIVIKEVPDAATRFAMLKTGQADFALAMTGPVRDAILADPKLSLVGGPAPGVASLIFSEQFNPKSPWSNLNVRQAANLAIDRVTLVATAIPGAPIPGQVIPDALLWVKRFTPDPYDVPKAKALLAEAGYRNGFDGGTFYVDQPYADAATLVAGYWKAVGISIKVEPRARAAYYEALNNHALRGVLFNINVSGTTASSQLQNFFTIQDGYGKYEDVSALMNQQLNENDPKKRQAILFQLQDLIHQKAMFVPIFQTTQPIGVGPRVKTQFHGKSIFPQVSVPYEDNEVFPGK
jgi:peptide/nickel transport system substrate-binding protein